jgi:hypothetical protein
MWPKTSPRFEPYEGLAVPENGCYEMLRYNANCHYKSGRSGIPAVVLGHLYAASTAFKSTTEPFAERFTKFTEALSRAQDAARAAWAAGYDELEVELLADGLTALIAGIASLLRDETMRRILDGRIAAEEATEYLAMLKEKWTPQAEENAARWKEMAAQRNSEVA